MLIEEAEEHMKTIRSRGFVCTHIKDKSLNPFNRERPIKIGEINVIIRRYSLSQPGTILKDEVVSKIEEK